MTQINYNIANYQRLPIDIAKIVDLSPTTKLVYSLIFSMSPFFARNEYIAGELSISTKKVEQALKDLDQGGHIARIKDWKNTKVVKRTIVPNLTRAKSFIIPGELFFASSIKPTDKILYGAISFFTVDGVCKYSNRLLAYYTGISERTTRTSLKRLVAGKYISVDSAGIHPMVKLYDTRTGQEPDSPELEKVKELDASYQLGLTDQIPLLSLSLSPDTLLFAVEYAIKNGISKQKLAGLSDGLANLSYHDKTTDSKETIIELLGA